MEYDDNLDNNICLCLDELSVKVYKQYLSGDHEMACSRLDGQDNGRYVLTACTIFILIHANIPEIKCQGNNNNNNKKYTQYETQPRFTGTGGDNNRSSLGGGPSGFPRHTPENNLEDNGTRNSSPDNFSPLDAVEIDIGEKNARDKRIPSRDSDSTLDDTSFIVSPPTPPPSPHVPTDPPGGKYPCQWRDSCFHANSGSVPLGERNCYCDDLCHVYRDCCEDKYNIGTRTRRLKPLAFTSFSCWSDTTVDPKPFYLVTKCPRKTRNSESAKKCEDERDPWNFMPVSGKQSKILYKNEHCARCHRDRDVEIWGYQVNCYNLQVMRNATAIVVNNAELFLTKPMKSLCNTSYVSPSGTTRPRYCKKITFQDTSEDVKISCPTGTDPGLKRKCQKKPAAYRYPAQFSHYIFRNQHCAMCWNINVTDLRCQSDVHTDKDGSVIGPISVATLFNFSTGELAITEKGKTSFIRVASCADHEVYHPRFARCVQRYTRKGIPITPKPTRSNRRRKRTTPVPPTTKKPRNRRRTTTIKVTASSGSVTQEVPSDQDNSSVTDMLDRDCAYVALEKNEYVTLKNGSLFYMNKVYLEEDITYTSDGKPLMCTNYKKKYNITVMMFKYNRTQSFISFVGTIMSLGGLFLLFMVYMRFRALRNIPGKCLICLVFSLFVAQLLLLVGVPRTEHQTVCVSLGIASHYVWLAAFFWMNVLSFDIWRTFATKVFSSADDNRSSRFIVYSVYAWLVPALIVGGSAALDYVPVDEIYRPFYGRGLCWITQKYPLLFMFALPMAVVIATNIVFFVMSIISICVATKSSESVGKDDSLKISFIVYIKLSLIMGLSWAFAFLASITQNDVLWYVFIVLNSFCGVFLCITFLCTKRVYRLCRDGGSPKKLYDPRTTVSTGTGTPNGYSGRSSLHTGQTRQSFLAYENTGAKVGSHETSI